MQKEFFEDEFKALGTQIHIWVLFDMGEEKIKKDIEELKELYLKKEKNLSRFNPESELNYFNHNLGKFMKASQELLHLCRKAIEYNKFSQGLFDPRIIETLENIGYDKDFKDICKPESIQDSVETHCNASPRINPHDLSDNLQIKGDEVLFKKRMDFSGIAKGYITDEGVKLLKDLGWKNFILDSGGDMFASGKNNSEKWDIELEGFSAEKLKLKLQDEAVATSGITRRKWEAGEKKFHHLINPKNPSNFSFDLKSVSAIARTTEEADVLAKILFLMGKTEGLRFASQKNIPAIFLDYKGSVFVSKNVKGHIILNQ